MTREEAIKLVKEVTGMSLDWDDAHYEALQMAIKALEQEGYYKDLAQSYEKTIVKLTEAVAEQQPSDDCVSRQVAIDYLYTNMAWYDENGSIADDSQKLRDITNLVNGIPSVTPTQRWIPVSERLPEANDNYLAFYRSSDGTATLEFMMVDHCNADGDWLHEESGRKSYRKVIAWMPLPEPYKAESEE